MSLKPDKVPPKQYTPSFARLGVVAQRDRLIEVRAPDPDGGAEWPHIWLERDAAEKLYAWLPKAIAVAAGREEAL